ncbi:hypothetical protein [Gordonibacter pamelaeae]|nr:hypothetical protein [Gordonibacter pamelaeae]
MKTVGFEVKKKRTPPKKDAGQKGDAQNAGADGAAGGKDAVQKGEDDDA